MSHEKLIHKGSTKDVYAYGSEYLFRFSDRYSVFDWGEMPDHLEGKGKALARFTKAVYQTLAQAGIKHHLVDKPCAENEIVVRPFEVVRDGSSLSGKSNVFIPLEVIFRMGYAKGSSIKKRFKSKEDWISAGLDREYNELEMFSSPFIEFTTKLERFDRPLTHKEAKELSFLNDKEWNSLMDTTTKIALVLRDLFEKSNIQLWDGKIELALDENRNIVLVDSIGPDELRLTKNGVQLSKEIIRQHYRNTDWYLQLDNVKAKHGESFKQFIAPPPALPKEFKTSLEELYNVLAEAVKKPEESDHAINRISTRLRNFV